MAGPEQEARSVNRPPSHKPAIIDASPTYGSAGLGSPSTPWSSSVRPMSVNGTTRSRHCHAALRNAADATGRSEAHCVISMWRELR